jgi:hypothetical protein
MDNSANFLPEAEAAANPTCWSREIEFQEIPRKEPESISGDFQQMLDAPLSEYLRREPPVTITSAPTAGILEIVGRVTSDLQEEDLARIPRDLSKRLG